MPLHTSERYVAVTFCYATKLLKLVQPMAVSAVQLEGPEYVQFLEAREQLQKEIEAQAESPVACFDHGIIITAGGAQLLTNALLNVKVCEDIGHRSQAM